MKMLNNISRSQAQFRRCRITASDLQSGHYAFVFAICATPGCSQEHLAEELCINKSTVARNLAHLEECGYVKREPLSTDKRQFSVYPTKKMLDILPLVEEVSAEWMRLLAEGIDEESLKIFNSVLLLMESRARELSEG